MTNIKYPEQSKKLKEMRKLVGITAQEASDIVHTDLRNWQRWEAGENIIPEGIVDLFCIVNGLKYKDFATPKTKNQIERDKKRLEKFEQYKNKVAEKYGNSQAHGLQEDEIFDEEIEEISNKRLELRNNILLKNKINLKKYDDRAQKILELFKKNEDLILYVFDQKELERNGDTVLTDRKLLNSNEFKVLSYTEKLLIKLARNLWNGEDEISIYDIIEQLDDRSFNIFMSVLRSLKK
ncbi:MAG: YdiL family protein [Silvanigrellaceae bacterium]|nr:YdiL family protein [Silvanigrellaceae bacterium]